MLIDGTQTKHVRAHLKLKKRHVRKDGMRLVAGLIDRRIRLVNDSGQIIARYNVMVEEIS